MIVRSPVGTTRRYPYMSRLNYSRSTFFQKTNESKRKQTIKNSTKQIKPSKNTPPPPRGGNAPVHTEPPPPPSVPRSTRPSMIAFNSPTRSFPGFLAPAAVQFARTYTDVYIRHRATAPHFFYVRIPLGRTSRPPESILRSRKLTRSKLPDNPANYHPHQPLSYHQPWPATRVLPNS